MEAIVFGQVVWEVAACHRCRSLVIGGESVGPAHTKGRRLRMVAKPEPNGSGASDSPDVI